MRGVWTWLVLTLSVLCVVTSWTDTAHAGPDDDRREAERLSDEGIGLAKQKNFEAAVQKFEAALKLFPHPVIMHNLGRAYEAVGDERKAYEYFARALQEDYPFATDGRERLNRLSVALAKTHGRLMIRVTPSQSKTILTMADGKTQTFVTSPFTVWVKVGETQINVTNNDFKSNQQVYNVTPGEEKELQIVLSPLPRLGFLRLSVNVPGANVSLSGRVLGKTPLQSVAVDAGVYQLEVQAPGYEKHLEPITITKDAISELTVTLKSNAGTLRPIPTETTGTPSWVGWTLVGSGIAVAGGGLATYLVAADKANALGLKYPIIEGAEDTNTVAYLAAFDREVQPLNIASTAMFIGGGVLATTGIILLLASPEANAPHSSANASAFVPDLRVGPGGVQLGGTWRF